MALDPYHNYSNEAERAIDKLKQPFGLHGLHKPFFVTLGNIQVIHF